MELTLKAERKRTVWGLPASGRLGARDLGFDHGAFTSEKVPTNGGGI